MMNNVATEILIVDDEQENIDQFIKILDARGYRFSYALSAKEAIELLKKKRFDLIVIDQDMPNIDGFQLCKVIKNTPVLVEIPTLFLADRAELYELEEGFSLGCSDYITKPFSPHEVQTKIINQLDLYKYRSMDKNVVANDSFLTDIEDAQKEMVYILSAMVEESGVETACHVKRVANFAKQLAILEGNLIEDDIKTLFLATPLYDLGKVFIEDEILNKPDQLTPYEFEVMKKHPKLALDVLRHSSKKLINAAAIIAYEHHENYDGSGYPRGLKGEEIHIYGRIVAIADVLDALLEEKEYKKAWSFEEAAKYIIEQQDKKFDPRLVTLFSENLEMFKEIAEAQEENC